MHIIHPGAISGYSLHSFNVQLLFVELNHDGSCERYIRSECGLNTDEWNKKVDHLRKFSLYPFMVEEIEEKIK